MIQLRVVKRTDPNGEQYFVIQKIKRCGFLFRKEDWKDCGAFNLTFNAGDIHRFVGLGTNKFQSKDQAESHLCYFDGSESVDTVI
jgi:hypothetical protein